MDHTSLAIILFMGWIIIAIGKVTARQAKQLNPKIDIFFHQNEGGIVENTEQVINSTSNPNLVTVYERKAVYIRINIKSFSSTTLKDCHALLTQIEKRTSSGSFIPIALSFPLLLTPNGLIIHPEIIQPVDFLKCNEIDKKIEPVVPYPLNLRDKFNDHATYRFTISVNACGLTKKILVDIEWRGEWDKITATQVKISK